MSTRKGVRIVCACCDQVGSPGARGLRSSCYQRHARIGTLHQFAPLIGPRNVGTQAKTDDMLTVWYRMMRGPGATVATVADHLGVNPRALEKAVERARARGDRRAIHTWVHRNKTGISSLYALRRSRQRRQARANNSDTRKV